MFLFSVLWTADGGPGAELYGASVAAAGDVNGDGYGDVIVGAPGFSDTDDDEGAAYVYQGGATGLYGTDPAWTTDSNQAGAELGAAVAGVGDVNGDGFSDVGAGVPGWDGGQVDEGRAFVWHGGAYGLELTASWTAESDQVGARHGSSFASAGDVNRDGYGDAIVGASGYDGVAPDSGGAWFYFGSPSGLRSDPDWTAEGNEAYAGFGSSVASAGDVEGDGYDDVVVGAWSALAAGARADLFLGSASGLSPTAAWTTSGGSDSGLGGSVAGAGDVDGDAYGDVLVGAFLFDDLFADEGAAFAFHGSADRPSKKADWIVTGFQLGAEAGRSVAGVGDVNADGHDDVAVGSPAYDTGFVDNGRVQFYLGSEEGLGPKPIWIAEGAGQAGADFGAAVSTAGDVDGDGYADVIVGAPNSGPSGRVVVLYGGYGVDSDRDGVFNTDDICLGDDASGDVDYDGVCALDVDGAVLDCDDTNAAVHPDAPEACDGLDTSCSGMVPANENDLDADGAFVCGGDCNVGDAAASPNRAEVCGDQIDNDCDGDKDESCLESPEPATSDVACGCITPASPASLLPFAFAAWSLSARRRSRLPDDGTVDDTGLDAPDAPAGGADPEIVTGETGCACATTAPPPSLTSLLLFALGWFPTRRRR